MEPELIRHNFRVEAWWATHTYHAYAESTEKIAQELAHYITQLRDVDTGVNWDVRYRCPNCKAEADTKEMLLGCCEENPG